MPASTPFDAPCGDDLIGVRYEHGHLLTVLDVRPGPAAPQPVDRPWQHLQRGTGLPWRALADWMARPDAAATTVTVLTHGTSVGDDGPAARAYRTLLGPLSVASTRTVRLAVRFSPLVHPEAVARYGTGTPAALRAALAAHRKIAALLAHEGLASTALTAVELTEYADQLEPWTAAPGSYVISPGDPADLPAALESAWRLSPSADTALVWRAAPSAPEITALARIDRADDAAVRSALPPHWHRLIGPGAPVPLPRETASGLAGAVLPMSGSGLIVGADSDSAPVAMRLSGDDLPLATITGEVSLAQRLAVRLAALGTTTAVFTDRPEAWHRVIEAVRDPRRLHPAADGAAEVLIDDRANGRLGPLAGHTVIRVGHREAPGTAIPSIIADADDHSRLLLTAGGVSTRVRLVSTPAEDALLGR